MDVVQIGALMVIAWIGWSYFPKLRIALRAKRFGLEHITAGQLAEAFVGLVMFVVFFYGVFKFSDAPIKPCVGSTGFCGKSGLPHTFADYNAFNAWQTTLLLVWPVGFFLAWLLRRRRQS